MKQRTPKQNSALHLYLEHLAEALNAEGHTLQDVVKRIQKAEIRPTKNNLKEVVAKPMAKALWGIESTTKLDSKQVDILYDHINLFISHNFGISVPFPSIETKNNEER